MVAALTTAYQQAPEKVRPVVGLARYVDSQDDIQPRAPWRTTADVSGLLSASFDLARTSADDNGHQKDGLQNLVLGTTSRHHLSE
jgi:hypothetical protein